MRAAMVQDFGPPAAIVIEDRPIPLPGPGEVVALVAAAGINFADLLMIAGRYQVRPTLPFTPGLEFAGTITALGSGVTRWRVGDRVMGAPPSGGCFADYVVVPEQRVFAAPDDLPTDLAAGFLLAYGTAGFAFRRARLAPGETVLVTGAGGGVGTAAVEVAKRLGATVIAAAGSADKLRVAQAHGADHAVNYRTEDLRPALKALTGGRGVDVVLELVGGEVFDQALKSTARWGRVLVVGFAGGTLPRIPAEYLLVKNLSVLGAGFGGALVEDPVLAATVIDDLVALHRTAGFTPEIAGRVPLDGIAAALDRLANRAVSGKLTVVPSGSGSKL